MRPVEARGLALLENRRPQIAVEQGRRAGHDLDVASPQGLGRRTTTARDTPTPACPPRSPGARHRLIRPRPVTRAGTGSARDSSGRTGRRTPGWARGRRPSARTARGSRRGPGSHPSPCEFVLLRWRIGGLAGRRARSGRPVPILRRGPDLEPGPQQPATDLLQRFPEVGGGIAEAGDELRERRFPDQGESVPELHPPLASLEHGLGQGEDFSPVTGPPDLTGLGDPDREEVAISSLDDPDLAPTVQKNGIAKSDDHGRVRRGVYRAHLETVGLFVSPTGCRVRGSFEVRSGCLKRIL